MKSSYQQAKLVQPYTRLGLKNRLVMAPMTRCKCDARGIPTKELGEYYIERARSGVGLIIIESCAVNDREAFGYINGCQLNNEEQANAWRPIIKEIHNYHAKVWVQIFHAGRLTVPEICGGMPLAPSPIKPEGQPSFWRPKLNGELVHFQSKSPFIEPKEIKYDDIDRILQEFKASCCLAAYAGFDGVEIHGAHGYLVHEFCSKFSNRRNDDYSISNGFAFTEKLIKMCKEELLNNMHLSYRLSLHMIDNTYLGLGDVDLSGLIPLLDVLGVDVFHSSEFLVGEKAFRSECSLGSKIRSLTDKPIIGCGGLNSIADGEGVINSSNIYDLVAFGRSLILYRRPPDENGDVKFNYGENFDQL